VKVFLTKQARKKYNSIKDYITLTWGEKVATAFEQKTFDFLDLLESFPGIGTEEIKNKKIRSFQLTNQTRVFYRIKVDRILILTLFDVRQDPKKKPR
jgi:plasmid stabilization system protein ParE